MKQLATERDLGLIQAFGTADRTDGLAGTPPPLLLGNQSKLVGQGLRRSGIQAKDDPRRYRERRQCDGKHATKLGRIGLRGSRIVYLTCHSSDPALCG